MAGGDGGVLNSWGGGILLSTAGAAGFGGAMLSSASSSEDICTTTKDGLGVENDDDLDIDEVKAEDPCSRATIRRNWRTDSMVNDGIFV